MGGPSFQEESVADATPKSKKQKSQGSKKDPKQDADRQKQATHRSGSEQVTKSWTQV